MISAIGIMALVHKWKYEGFRPNGGQDLNWRCMWFLDFKIQKSIALHKIFCTSLETTQDSSGIYWFHVALQLSFYTDLYVHIELAQQSLLTWVLGWISLIRNSGMVSAIMMEVTPIDLFLLMYNVFSSQCCCVIVLFTNQPEILYAHPSYTPSVSGWPSIYN